VVLMRLTDDAFTPNPDPRPQNAARMPIGQLKEALAGIGDKSLRQAQDFLWSMGMPLVDTEAGWRPAVGDEVEFVLGADGYRRCGTVQEISPKDAIVKVADGEYNIVPLPFLEPLNRHARREQKAEAIKAAIRGNAVINLHETRSLIALSPTDYAMTLEYRAGMFPPEDDVRLFVAQRYPGARIIDGDDTHPGKLGLVISFPNETEGRRALQASRQAQTSGPMSPPSTRENATGIGKEEIEGTGKIGDAIPGSAMPQGPGDVEGAGVPRSMMDYRREKERYDQQQMEMRQQEERAKQRRMQQRELSPPGVPAGVPIVPGKPLEATARYIERLAERNPSFDFIETSFEEDANSATSHFAIKRAGRPLFIKEGQLTPVLGLDAAPAVGLVMAFPCTFDDGVHGMAFAARMHGPDGDVPLDQIGLRLVADMDPMSPYGTGTGPQSLHENEPGANESGSYVIKADGGVQSPAATEEDGEHRESIGGPGLHVAVDAPTKDYYEEYFGPYGEQLTDDVAKRAEQRLALVRAAWAEAGRGEPTAEDVLWAVGILGAPLAWTPGQRRADAIDELAQELIQTSQVSSAAGQRLQQLVSGYLAKADPAARAKYRPDDPKVLQSVLPQVLRSLPPKQLNQIRYQFTEGYADKPSWFQRMLQPGMGRTRQETQRSREIQRLMSPAPAAPAAPGGTAPTKVAPVGDVPAAGGQTTTLPAGTSVTTPEGKKVRLTGPTPVETDAGESAAPAAPAPAAPAAPAAPSAPEAPMGPTQMGAPPGQLPAEPRAAYVNLPAGATVYAFRGKGRQEAMKPTKLAEATTAQIVSDQGDHLLLRTAKGEIIAVGKQVAQAQMSHATGGDPIATGEDISNVYAGGSPAEAYRGRMPPAKLHLHMRMVGLVRRGDYLIGTVIWDTEAAKSMSPSSLVQNLKSYVKQRSSEKEFLDLGFIGKPVIELCDFETGMAEIRFRSSESRIAPPEYVQKEDASYVEPVR
jgi:hypothetical protein